MIELFLALIRAGHTTGHRSGLERVRAVGLYAAALVISASMATGFLMYGAVTGTYQLDAYGVVQARTGAGDPPTLLWRETTDALRDGREFRIVFLTPLTPDAPLPPGVAQWPARGEVWMSPALREAGAADGIEQRYGRTVGVISRRGLADSSELLAYIRPTQDLSVGQARPVVRFVPTPRGGWVFRDYPDRQREWILHPVLIAAMLLSGLVLLFVAARVRSPGLEHRVALVAALGGRRIHRAAVVAGESWLPTFTGALTGAMVALAVPLTGITLPDNLVMHMDPPTFLRVCLGVVLSWLLTPVLVTVFDALPRRTGTVPASRAIVWCAAAACPVMVSVAWYGPALLPLPRLVTYAIGAAGAVVTLPAVVALVVTGLARLWAYQGRVRGRASHLVGGRQAAAHPGAVARIAATVTVGLCLWSQVPVWHAVLDTEAQRDPWDSRVLDVAPHGSVSESQVDGFLAALPSGTRVVTMRFDAGGLWFQGGCQDLAALSLPCRTTKLAVIPPPVAELVVRHGRGSAPMVRVGSDGESSRTLAQDRYARLILAAPDGDKLSIPDVKRLAFRVLPLGAAVVDPQAGPPAPVLVQDERDRWPGWAGLVTIAVLIAAAGLVGARRFLYRARLLGRLTVFGSTDPVLRSSATWWVLVPLTLAGVVGTAVAVLLAAPVAAVSALPIGLMLTCAGWSFALGFVITEWVTLIAIQETGSRYGIGARDKRTGGAVPTQRRTNNPVRASRIDELYVSPARDFWG